MAHFIEPKLRIMAGDRYHRLVVTEVVPGKVHSLCDCGTPHTIRRDHWGKAVKSCGCLAKELISVRSTTHGMTKSPTYRTWVAMIQRCTNPGRSNYPYYGGRGITVCSRWRNSFEAFLQDMGERPDGMTLDRVDTDGSYEPGNCRWATKNEQAQNQRPRAPRAPKTHCKRRHALSGTNLRINKAGQRSCKECARARNREAYRAQSKAVSD
ncbi:hypothetical protein OG258_19885 [Streptomyces mirabilis]|uniref:hypothetical protein n=1 Tax=Streptomyces mirabilis TaxID=68239 RepID=UPI002E2E36CF|nr:hypothetical protein [Streptomyces mirabilis]